jgi:hypothetical protein
LLGEKKVNVLGHHVVTEDGELVALANFFQGSATLPRSLGWGSSMNLKEPMARA